MSEESIDTEGVSTTLVEPRRFVVTVGLGVVLGAVAFLLSGLAALLARTELFAILGLALGLVLGFCALVLARRCPVTAVAAGVSVSLIAAFFLVYGISPVNAGLQGIPALLAHSTWGVLTYGLAGVLLAALWGAASPAAARAPAARDAPHRRDQPHPADPA